MSEFLVLVPEIKERTGIDFSNYASSSLERRIESVVLRNFKGNIPNFLQFIKSADKKQVIELVNEIMVNTTEFYRDWPVWHLIKKEFPEIIRNFNSIRIWHAGCSTGEEVISLAILLSEMGFKDKMRIFATDISERALETAKMATYKQKVIDLNSSNINEIIGMDAFRKYFEVENDSWKLKSELLPEFIFKKMDLSSMEPYSKYDIIFCRNVMIYFNVDLQRKVLDLFNRSLFNGGLLITGKQENANLVLENKKFSLISRDERIFRKNE